eukprot:scaffold82612_cov89-Phaeocystis_antarctica.AAC.1
MIGAKSKVQKHAFWPALCSAACGGAVRRCAAPSAATRALRAAPPGRYAPSALRAHPVTCYEHEKKAGPCFCLTKSPENRNQTIKTRQKIKESNPT